MAEALRPVPLLALLKHPLAAAGLTPARCRAAARRLEREGLRGPAPHAGLAGCCHVTDREPPPLHRPVEAAWPAAGVAAADAAAPADALAALIAAAEALAATPDRPGAHRLWSGEDGQALAALLGELLPALAVLPPQPPATLPGLLEAALAGAWCAAAGRCGGAAGSSIRACRSGACWRRGCSGPTRSCWAAWRRACGPPPPILGRG